MADITPTHTDEAQAVFVKVRPGNTWVVVVAEPKHLNPRKYGDDRRQTMWEALSGLLPEGYEAVALSTSQPVKGAIHAAHSLPQL